MTFYLIGTGMSAESITIEGVTAVRKCKKAFLENYTVDFPYEKKFLERKLNKKIVELSREKVESEDLIKESKKDNIALLVYGDALSATTHSELILSCKKNKVPYVIIHNASVLTSVAECGLQLYKFGKTASMPTWKDNWKPDSFVEIIKQNQSIDAHTLLLVDIGLKIDKAKEQLAEALKNHKMKIGKIIACSELGVGDKAKIEYSELDEISHKIRSPYCFVIPGKMHFLEEEFLENL